MQVHCTGVRHFMTGQRDPQTELDVLTHYVPGSLTYLLMGELRPNFNYSCVVGEEVASIAQVVGHRASDPFYFTTNYDGRFCLLYMCSYFNIVLLLDPKQPKSPRIHVQDDKHYRVDLFPVSSKNGPLL